MPLPEATSPLTKLPTAYALAVTSGVLYALGVPGIDVWPMAFVAYVPLLVAIRGRTPREAALLGVTAGTVASLGGFYWLFSMMRLFGGLPVPVCVLLTVATCAYQGGRTALTAWLTTRAARNGWPAALVFVCASITAELVYPLLFPWYLAFMMHRTPLLVQAADVGGVYLAGALLLGPNVALAELVTSRLERARVKRDVVIAGLLAPLVGLAYGAIRAPRIAAMEQDAQTISVGIAQGNLPLITRRGGVLTNRELTEDLQHRGANLVVWSESSIPETLDEEKLRKNTKYGRVTGNLDVPVIFGANLRSIGTNGRPRELNSAFLADFDGKIVGRYDKQYLLPFGEFIPFGRTFPKLYQLSPNSGHLAPGDSVAPLELDGHRITVLICYEDILPWFVNHAVNEGRPDLLVNLTVDTWFGDTIEPREHLALAQLRAIEHRRYLVRATNSGISAIIDPMGRVTVSGGQMKREALLGDVRFMAPTTVYEVVGDVPWYALALFTVGLAMTPRKRRDES